MSQSQRAVSAAPAGLADRFRSRAQAAAGLAGTAAGVVSAGLAFASGESFSSPSKGLALAALVGFVASVAFYTWASLYSASMKDDEAGDDDDFAYKVTRRIHHLTVAGSCLGLVSALCVIGAVTFIAFDRPRDIEVRVLVRPESAKDLAAICPPLASRSEINGRLAEPDLNDGHRRTVTIEVPPGGCAAPSVAIQLPVTDILAIRADSASLDRASR